MDVQLSFKLVWYKTKFAVDSEVGNGRGVVDFIISKGMGNYEGLTEIDLSSKEVFFLLCSKCTTISKDIGVNLHDMLLLKNRN